MSNVVLIKALSDKLRADNLGAGSLVSLTGDAAGSRSIKMATSRVPAKFPCLDISIQTSVPLIREITTFTVFVVKLAACAKTELSTIQIADRVEFLFHDVGGTARSYYDFTGSSIVVQSTRWLRRLKLTYDNDNDYWMDSNLVEIIANTTITC